MSDDDKWHYIIGVLLNLQNQQIRLNKATNQLLISPESSLIEPFFEISDDLILTLSLLINDKSEYISWYVLECDFGNNPHKAGCEDNMRLIDDFYKLRWLIELDCLSD